MSGIVRWTPDAAGLELTTAEEAPPLAFPLPPGSPAERHRELEVLEELWGEERLDVSDGVARMPWPTVYGLSPSMRNALAIPDPRQDFEGYLRADGWIRGPQFRLWLELEYPEGGRMTTVRESDWCGAMVKASDGYRLAPEALGLLMLTVAQEAPDSPDQRAVLVAQAQELARQAGVRQDQFLSNEEYRLPAGLTVEIEGVSPEEIRLRPVVESEEGATVLPDGRVRTTYSERLDGGRRRRLVLSEEQKADVQELAKRRVLRGADVPLFLENPEAFLPDGFDLERFSPRVKGLIPYRYHSQPYLSVTNNRARDWLEVSAEIELLVEEPEEAPPGGWRGEGGEARPEGSAGPEGPDTDAPQAPTQTAAPVGEAPQIDPADYRKMCEAVLETGERHQRHGDAWITIDPERARRYLESWEHLEEGEDGSLRLPRSAVGMVLDVISNTEALDFDAGAVDFFTAPEVPEYPPPTGFRGQLRPYQETGYRWLRFLHEQGLGGLLADDMGLGKTVQVAAYMAHLNDEGRLGPALVVVPNALVPNWEREIRRFAPGVHLIHRHQGTHRARDPKQLHRYDVVITTYGTLRRDQLLLGQVDWTMIVCDEAQNVKNPSAAITSAVKGMKADLRLAATGTPVENGLSELWCIMDFAQPGRLGSHKEFRTEYERPIVDADSETAQRLEASRRLQERLIPHYVRRTKEDALNDLPGKTVRRYAVPMSDRQKELYAQVIGRIRSGAQIPIAGLQQLIQVCSHPELVAPTAASNSDLLEICPKLAKTMEVLEGIRRLGEKVVIFTRFREMQDILQRVISERFGVMPRVLNGDSSGDRRQQIVDVFNDQTGFHAMILSPEAAGVGLNITGANHAIHYTRLWNPAKENQATDRIHRLGQKRPVTVHYPIVEWDHALSVEQHLDELLDDKLELARDVLVPRDLLKVTGDLERRVMGAN